MVLLALSVLQAPNARSAYQRSGRHSTHLLCGRGYLNLEGAAGTEARWNGHLNLRPAWRLDPELLPAPRTMGDRDHHRRMRRMVRHGEGVDWPARGGVWRLGRRAALPDDHQDDDATADTAGEEDNADNTEADDTPQVSCTQSSCGLHMFPSQQPLSQWSSQGHSQPSV